jgi:probable HAF family extracellular repeat protein
VASGINASGRVSGTAATGAVDRYGGAIVHAFVWDPAHERTDLGTLQSDVDSYGGGFNDAGAVAGTSSTAPVPKADRCGDTYYVSTDHAVTWDSTHSVKKLGNGDGRGINDAGEVVGFIGNNAILWSSTAKVNLGTLGGTGYQSVALGINGAGQVVGYAPTNDSYQTQHASLWTPTTPEGTKETMQDLGSLTTTPGYPGGGTSVNAAGEVLGWSAGDAFLYVGGTMYDLGTLTAVGGPYTPSTANGINDSGAVVGNAGSFSYPTSSASHAWVWVPTTPNGASGQMTDHNALIPAGSGWVINDATAINDAGQIVGSGTINGQAHAVLLNPVTTTTPTARSAIAGSTGINGLLSAAMTTGPATPGVVLVAAPADVSVVPYVPDGPLPDFVL